MDACAQVPLMGERRAGRITRSKDLPRERWGRWVGDDDRSVPAVGAVPALVAGPSVVGVHPDPALGAVRVADVSDVLVGVAAVSAPSAAAARAAVPSVASGAVGGVSAGAALAVAADGPALSAPLPRAALPVLAGHPGAAGRARGLDGLDGVVPGAAVRGHGAGLRGGSPEPGLAAGARGGAVAAGAGRVGALAGGAVVAAAPNWPA